MLKKILGSTLPELRGFFGPKMLASVEISVERYYPKNFYHGCWLLFGRF